MFPCFEPLLHVLHICRNNTAPVCRLGDLLPTHNVVYLLSVCRYLLLAANTQQAADKALTHLQPLVQQLEQLHESTCDTSKSALVSSQLLQLEQVQQLLLWQDCLESLEAAALTPESWHAVFSCCLLAGAIRAFAYEYFQVCDFKSNGRSCIVYYTQP